MVRGNRRIAAIGVDRGGTWLRVVAIDQRGRVVDSQKLPSPSLDRLRMALTRIWRRLAIDKTVALGVASAGVWRLRDRAQLERRLDVISDRVVVLSDAEAAYLGAFGNQRGVLVIAGTGSIAITRSREGNWIRRGGLGPRLGDEGSGYWIGREYLKRAGRRPRSRSISGIASLAPVVLAKAAAGDKVARCVVDEACEHLANLVEDTAQAARLKSPWEIAVAGGLMSNSPFRRRIVSHLAKRQIAAGLRRAVRGAEAVVAILAMKS